jgi:uncharacterized protein YndB with AHSA1/START domain
MTIATQGADDRTLVLARIIDAPAARLFAAWTQPELMKQWFAPKPWTTPSCEVDLRVGGVSRIVMRSPEGVDHPNVGVYLLVEPDRRLVFTDAFTSAWAPAQKPFMVGDLSFEEKNGRTTYTATVRHWTVEDREAHEKMGFHEGWGKCADQLAALVAKS